MNGWIKRLNIEKLKMLCKYYLKTQKLKAHEKKKKITDLIKKSRLWFYWPLNLYFVSK